MKLIGVIALLWCNLVFGQYLPIQSQYMFNGISINPATAGSDDSFSILGNLRSQWSGFPGAPKTENLSFHAPLKSQNSALGLQLYADQIGVDRNTGIYGMYAYRLRFESSTLSIGLAAGVNFLKSYYSRLEVTDTQDNLLMTDSPLGILPDFSFGLHYYSKKYFISASLPYFVSHFFDGTKYRLYNDPLNYNFTIGGGYEFDVSENFKLKPSFLVKLKIHNNPQVDFNVMAKFNDQFSTGVSYRTNEAIIALFKVNPSPQFAIIYSFGLPLNQFLNYTYGSHEIGLKYNFAYKTKMTNPRFLSW